VRPLPVLVALTAAGVLIGGLVMALRPEPELPGLVRDPAPQVVGLEFLDHRGSDEGTPTELVPPEGALTLAYFGYLSCPDMCPLTMADLRRAREQVGPELAARTRVAFVTLDPDRDDPSSLRRYLSFFFDEDYLALRAPDPAALDRAAERLGVRFEVEDHVPGQKQYEVSHSAITYVIDDRGTLVRELPFGAPAEDYARVIEAALLAPAA
jgi:protein SCO1